MSGFIEWNNMKRQLGILAEYQVMTENHQNVRSLGKHWAKRKSPSGVWFFIAMGCSQEIRAEKIPTLPTWVGETDHPALGMQKRKRLKGAEPSLLECFESTEVSAQLAFQVGLNWDPGYVAEKSSGSSGSA